MDRGRMVSIRGALHAENPRQFEAAEGFRADAEAFATRKRPTCSDLLWGLGVACPLMGRAASQVKRGRS